MISDMIEEDARTLDEMVSELNREAMKHKSARDNYHQQAAVLADKRNALQDKARKLVAEANLMKQRRDDYNLSAKEAKEKREEWNDKVAMMRERGGLGDIGEAKAQSQNYHQKVVKYSNSGQVAHEKMLQLRQDADKLRDEAQEYHEKYLDCKKAADLEHERYIQAIRKIEKVRDNLPD